ncbi:MAG: M48 family metalloprotease [Acidobacteriota bacterium]
MFIIKRIPRKIIALIISFTFLFSCMPTRVPPISSSGAAFQPEKDEKRLWDESRAEEKKFLEKAEFYKDPLLEDYLNTVALRLEPEGLAAQDQLAIRVRILNDPTLNAFAYPHGTIYVHTGLIARLENEDQIAGVIAHEMTHVENRHMLRYKRSIQNKQIGFMIAAIAGSIWAASEAGHAAEEGHWGKAARISQVADLLLGLGLQLAFIAAINGYGRNLEREADDGALKKMQNFGYNPAQMEKVYSLLLDDHGDGTKLETFFFGNHPQLKERIENTRAYLSSHPEINDVPAKANVDPQDFQRRVRSLLKDDALLNMNAGRFGIAEDELKRAIAIVPGDPVAHYLLGILYMKKADVKKEEAETLRQNALNFFIEAVQLDPLYADPHRELGLGAYRSGDFPTACGEFKKYIELAPGASDVARMKDYILELKTMGHCE